MAMKREYLSVDGEIFGEVTNGVANFDDRDALGTVAAIERWCREHENLRLSTSHLEDVAHYTGENPLSSPRRFFLRCGAWGHRVQ